MPRSWLTSDTCSRKGQLRASSKDSQSLMTCRWRLKPSGAYNYKENNGKELRVLHETAQQHIQVHMNPDERSSPLRCSSCLVIHMLGGKNTTKVRSMTCAILICWNLRAQLSQWHLQWGPCEYIVCLEICSEWRIRYTRDFNCVVDEFDKNVIEGRTQNGEIDDVI